MLLGLYLYPPGSILDFGLAILDLDRNYQCPKSKIQNPKSLAPVAQLVEAAVSKIVYV